MRQFALKDVQSTVDTHNFVFVTKKTWNKFDPKLKEHEVFELVKGFTNSVKNQRGKNQVWRTTFRSDRPPFKSETILNNS